MATERELQFECARMQSAIAKAEEGVQSLIHQKDKILPIAEARKSTVTKQARERFESQKQTDKAIVEQTCEQMRTRVDQLLDTFPDLDAKEFAGKYEIEELQQKLMDIYPDELIESYVCVDPLEFEEESDAYQVYTSAEHRVASMKQHNMAGAAFSGLTALMNSAASINGMGAKIVLVIVGILLLLTVLEPFLMLTLYGIVGLVSTVQGVYIAGILRKLYSVKEFLNDEYDEDIFQQDKNDVMADITEFLNGVREDYLAEIDERIFHEPVEEHKQIMAKAQEDIADIEAQIVSKKQNIDFLKQQMAAKVAEYEAVVAERKAQAQKAREAYLCTFDWKSEWYPNIFLDVNSEDKVISCPWTQRHTLYISKSLDMLQQFSQLVVLQNVMHVHPSFAGQIVMDYKYMGGNLLPFSRLNPAVVDLCIEPEKIEKKLKSMNVDVRARCTSILQACASIEDFNALMATYNAPGESYMTVHIFGLTSIPSELKMILKNGAKVGYYIKFYMTIDELAAQDSDFPYDDVHEYAEVSDNVIPRTATQLQRILHPPT